MFWHAKDAERAFQPASVISRMDLELTQPVNMGLNFDTKIIHKRKNCTQSILFTQNVNEVISNLSKNEKIRRMTYTNTQKEQNSDDDQNTFK